MTTGRHVVMIDNYDSFTWNLYQFLCQLPRCGRVDVFRNDQITLAELDALNPDILFVSPGPGHPTTDLGISRDVIAHYKGKKPIFGVCMGLQCIFDVFGGNVDYAGEIVHGKTTTIKHDNRGMFAGVPQLVAVTRYHSLAGTKGTLPQELEVTATTETNPEIIMGVRHREYTIEGVQFHPESILTEEGQMMIDNLLGVHGGTWKEAQQGQQGQTPAKKTGSNILETIYARRRADYEAIELLPGHLLAELETLLSLAGVAPPCIDFYQRLLANVSANKTNILAEFKRALPSKGDINVHAHPAVQALTYAVNGCATISVLTEPTWFKGSLDDLRVIRRAVEAPKDAPEGYQRPAVLRKEFIFNKYQIAEARLAGADTVLLIVKMLPQAELQELYSYCHQLGMVPLVEINNAAELKTALALTVDGQTREPLVLGVNNRNLTNFDVDLATTTNLVEDSKTNNGRDGPVLLLALLGILAVDDVASYKKEGVDGFLIGELLMRAEARGEAALFLGELINC